MTDYQKDKAQQKKDEKAIKAAAAARKRDAEDQRRQAVAERNKLASTMKFPFEKSNKPANPLSQTQMPEKSDKFPKAKDS